MIWYRRIESIRHSPRPLPNRKSIRLRRAVRNLSRWLRNDIAGLRIYLGRCAIHLAGWALYLDLYSGAELLLPSPRSHPPPPSRPVDHPASGHDPTGGQARPAATPDWPSNGRRNALALRLAGGVCFSFARASYHQRFAGAAGFGKDVNGQMAAQSPDNRTWAKELEHLGSPLRSKILGYQGLPRSRSHGSIGLSTSLPRLALKIGIRLVSRSKAKT
jgi:hypothetical protein